AVVPLFDSINSHGANANTARVNATAQQTRAGNRQAIHRNTVTTPTAAGIPMITTNIRADESAARNAAAPSKIATTAEDQPVRHAADPRTNHQAPSSSVHSMGPHIFVMKTAIAGRRSGAASQA